MKKVKIPTNEALFKKKILYNEKKDPIWVTLENEMRAKAAKGIKPYNEKVGEWLKYMKDLLYHYYITEKRNYNKLRKDIGPRWYIEFSQEQRVVLRKLKYSFHADILENRPTRTRKALIELGLTINFPKDMLMEAMHRSIEDPGIFFWELYKMHYGCSPSELLEYYDANAKRMMSALVFTDLEECRQELILITAKGPPPPPKPPKKQKPNYQPAVRFGEYLQKLYVPCYSNYPEKIPKPKKPVPITGKVKLRSAESYEKLVKKEDFLERRKERNEQRQPKERVCGYKFWKPPTDIRTKDPKLMAYAAKLKMFGKKPAASHLKNELNVDAVQTIVKGVTYAKCRPVYFLDNVVRLSSGYVPINGGYVIRDGQCLFNVLGYFKYPPDVENKCDTECTCETKWERQVKEYLQETRCGCNHFRDNEGRNVKKGEKKPKAKYFYPSKGLTPFYVDETEVYQQLDECMDFIRDGFRKALDSNYSLGASSDVSVCPNKLKTKDLLSAFLADLSEKPLIIPHLPDANLLKELQELVRQRVKGNLKKRVHKNLLLKSKRKWANLDHIDHNTRAYMIPFTKKQLESLNYSHRPRIAKLCEVMRENFESRTRDLWLEHTRIFWNTMKYEKYPNTNFLELFFTYMPVRNMDLFVFNPYSPTYTPKHGSKTCPLESSLRRWPENILPIRKRKIV